jgi:Protein of unknown function (DUF4230)
MYRTTSSEIHGIRRDRGIIRPIITGGVLVGAVLIGAGVAGLDLFDNPLATTTVDHSPAPILTELRDLGDYHAAQASFEVIVDQEQDVNLVPQFVAGERVQFVAIGNVDALVDFTGLGEAAIVVDPESGAVRITLPSPTIGTPVLDHDQSHVMNRDRGILNRMGGAFVDSPTTERELVLAAEVKMADAAAQTDLVARAAANTTSMLLGLLAPLGYGDVTVRFEPVTV